MVQAQETDLGRESERKDSTTFIYIMETEDKVQYRRNRKHSPQQLVNNLSSW